MKALEGEKEQDIYIQHLSDSSSGTTTCGGHLKLLSGDGRRYCGGHLTELDAYRAVLDTAKELGVDLGKYAEPVK